MTGGTMKTAHTDQHKQQPAATLQDILVIEIKVVRMIGGINA